MTQKRIPNQIDDPAILMFWSQDEFLPIITVLAIGFWTDWFGISFLVSWVTLNIYRKMRDGNPRGHFFHVAYWWGIGGAKNARTVHNPFIREFNS